jgi:hypothetical protein
MEITLSDLYFLIAAVAMVGCFGHGFTAGASL